MKKRFFVKEQQFTSQQVVDVLAYPKNASRHTRSDSCTNWAEIRERTTVKKYSHAKWPNF